MLWSFVIFAFSDLTWLVINLTITLGMLFLMMAATGQWLHLLLLANSAVYFSLGFLAFKYFAGFLGAMMGKDALTKLRAVFQRAY